MKWISYLKLFYFIAGNWNIKLAFFTVYHEIKGEGKYGIESSKIDDLSGQQIASENIFHASIYQPTNYYLIEKAFDYLKSQGLNHDILDFGCGKGRVLIVAAFYGFKNITGVDFTESFCREAEFNIEKVEPLFPSANFRVICGDAVKFKIENKQTVFFFFNPFDQKVMLAVVKNILASLKQNQRKIFVVYINPLHKEIFLSAGFEEEYFFRKMKYLEFSILSKDEENDL